MTGDGIRRSVTVVVRVEAFTFPVEVPIDGPDLTGIDVADTIMTHVRDAASVQVRHHLTVDLRIGTPERG